MTTTHEHTCECGTKLVANGSYHSCMEYECPTCGETYVEAEIVQGKALHDYNRAVIRAQFGAEFLAKLEQQGVNHVR